MSTTIYILGGVPAHTGRNLRVLLESPRRYGGVTRVRVTRNEAGALVAVFYKAGGYAETQFSCFEHARDWADRASTRNYSWFYRCALEFLE